MISKLIEFCARNRLLVLILTGFVVGTLVRSVLQPGTPVGPFEFDVPGVAEADFRGRLTEAVVRMADSMRAPDDVYHLLYRLPWDTEPVLLPVGPQLQELGERFSLLQSRGGMAGRTAVWLTLGREHALAEIVDPVGYDPEAAGEPEGLLTHPALRWSMATEWVRIGPSLLVRLMIVVPAHHARRVTEILDDVA